MDLIGILLLDPSTAPDGSHDYRRVRAELAARMPRFPVFASRPIEAPLGAGHEHWVVDPDFDIDYHVKHIGAPAPHDLQALCELATSLFDEPMDRTRPLWQVYYVDGLKDGAAAILLRLHHASVDGVGGAEMLTQLFDGEPLPADPALEPSSVDGERVPGQAEMFVRALPDQLLMPLRLAYRGLPVVMPLARRLAGRLTKPAPKPKTLPTNPPTVNPGPVPRSLFNRPTKTGKRAVAAATVPMADIRKIKDRFGVTVNDVVLSVTGAAVVDYLRDHDSLPGEALRVAGPVNIRDESATAGSGNHFAFMMVAIPTDIADPVERLKTVAALTRRAKPARAAKTDTAAARKPTGTGLGNVMRLIDTLPSGVWTAVRELVNSPAIEAIPPVTNYIVSNIPGPKNKLYFAGAQITHLYGRTMVGGGVGLFIHCISYGDDLDFGFTALAELVPDPHTIGARPPHHRRRHARSRSTPPRRRGAQTRNSEESRSGAFVGDGSAVTDTLKKAYRCRHPTTTSAARRRQRSFDPAAHAATQSVDRKVCRHGVVVLSSTAGERGCVARSHHTASGTHLRNRRGVHRRGGGDVSQPNLNRRPCEE